MVEMRFLASIECLTWSRCVWICPAICSIWIIVVIDWFDTLWADPDVGESAKSDERLQSYPPAVGFQWGNQSLPSWNVYWFTIGNVEVDNLFVMPCIIIHQKCGRGRACVLWCRDRLFQWRGEYQKYHIWQKYALQTVHLQKVGWTETLLFVGVKCSVWGFFLVSCFNLTGFQLMWPRNFCKNLIFFC